MTRSRHLLMIGAAVLALSACGEKPQELGSTAAADAPAFQGTGVAPFTAPDWQPGDQASWQQALKARARNQNEYPRVQGK